MHRKEFHNIALLSIAFFYQRRHSYIRHPADCVGLDSALVSSCGRAYLESVLVDTALVLLHGRVIRALSLLRLSSLAPCQRARRLLSVRLSAHRAMLPWHFPLRRTGAPKPTRKPPITAVCSEIPSMLRSPRKCEEHFDGIALVMGKLAGISRSCLQFFETINVKNAKR